MQTTMKATVYSVQKAVGPNGEQYVKAFIGQPADKDDPYTTGINLMSVSVDPRIFDTLPKLTSTFEAELILDLVRGGQNKMKQHCVSITPSKIVPAVKS